MDTTALVSDFDVWKSKHEEESIAKIVAALF